MSRRTADGELLPPRPSPKPHQQGRGNILTAAPLSIFFSHIHEEAPIALTLQNWCKACFPNSITTFVSSAHRDLPPGKNWFESVDAALGHSTLIIPILSPQSFKRMWIHLETGYALARRIDVLPIGHCGTRISNLPRPYSDFNGLEIERPDFAHSLLAALKQRLGFSYSSPNGMLDGLTKDVRAACPACARRRK